MNQFLLKDLLENIDSFDWKLALFTNKEFPFNENTLVYLAGPTEDRVTIDGDTFHYIFDVQTIRGIVENARQQKQKTSLSDLVEAINFYYKNDAFIDFNEA